MQFTAITDVGVMHLVQMTNLRELKLNGTQITNAGIFKLRKAIPKMNIAYGSSPSRER